MNWLIKADEWIISKYQAVADWINGLNQDISPYQIAAQLAGFVVVTQSALMAFNENIEAINIVTCIVMIIWSASTFATAKIKHNQWKRSKLSQPDEDVFGLVVRMMWIILIPMFIFRSSLTDVILTIQDIVIVSALYFLACRAPTPIFREEWKPVPNVT